MPQNSSGQNVKYLNLGAELSSALGSFLSEERCQQLQRQFDLHLFALTQEGIKFSLSDSNSQGVDTNKTLKVKFEFYLEEWLKTASLI